MTRFRHLVVRFTRRGSWSLLAAMVVTATSGTLAGTASAAVVDRIAGTDAYGTATLLALEGGRTGTVVLTTGVAFPDALAGGALAARHGGALLMTPPDQLPDVVRDALDVLNPDQVIVVGGPAAISQTVADAAYAAAGTSFNHRIGGNDRYETAVRLSVAGWPEGAETVFLATGESFADALAATAASGVVTAPILLTTRDTLPGSTRGELQRLRPKAVFVFGGTAAISDSVLGEAVTAAGVGAERVAGFDRYETAARVSARWWPAGSEAVFAAAGTVFTDALAAGALAARMRLPLLIVPSGSVPESISTELGRLGAGALTIAGAPSAVSGAVADQLAALTTGHSLWRDVFAGVEQRWRSSPPRTAEVTYRWGPDVASAQKGAIDDAITVAVRYLRSDAGFEVAAGNKDFAIAAYDEHFGSGGAAAMAKGGAVSGPGFIVVNLDAGNDLHDTLIHETVHVIQNERAGRVRGDSPIFPRWMTEGEATYYQAALGQLTGTSTLEPLRSMFVGHADDLGALEEYAIEWDPAGPYELGFLAVELLLDSYGEDAVRDFYVAAERAEVTDAAFETAFGLPIDQFYEDFEEYRAHLE